MDNYSPGYMVARLAVTYIYVLAALVLVLFGLGFSAGPLVLH